MKKMILFGLIIFLVLAMTSYAYTKTDYLKYVGSEVSITQSYSEYQICNPTETDVSIISKSKGYFNFYFNEVAGKLKNSWVKIKVNETFYKNEWQPDIKCIILPNATKQCNDNGKWVDVEKWRWSWKSWDYVGFNLEAKKCYDFRVYGTYDLAYKNPIAIDNIIQVFGNTYDEYAWWNITWSYRTNFTLTDALSDFYGFKIDVNASSLTNYICGGERLVDGTNNLELKFWRVSCPAESTSNITYFIKLNNSGNYNISLYTGNTSYVPDASDIQGASINALGDDFDDASLNTTKWTESNNDVSGGDAVESDGLLNISHSGDISTYVRLYGSLGLVNGVLYGRIKTDTNNNLAAGIEYHILGLSNLHIWWTDDLASLIQEDGQYVDGLYEVSYNDGVTTTTNNTSFYQTDWQDMKIILKSGSFASYYMNDTLVINHTANIPNEGLFIEMSSETGGASVTSGFWTAYDYVFLGNYSTAITYVQQSEEQNITADYTIISETYTASVYETQDTTFGLIFNTNSNVSDIAANLSWNGTNYTSTLSVGGSWFNFTRTLSIPEVASQTNITFQWFYVVSYTNGTIIYTNTTPRNQTINTLTLINCTGGNITLNFTAYDEETNSLMDFNMDSTFTYWVAGKPFTKNFSYSYTGNNTYLVCIAPSDVTIYSDATIKYWNDSYSTRYYYLQNATLDNNTDTVNLYLLNSSDSTQIVMRVLDPVDSPVEDVIILIQKQDIGEGSFIQIAEAKTDFSGYAYTYLELHEIYKFYLTKNGVVLREYQPMQLETNSLEFRISTAEIPEYFSYYDKVATSCSFSNSTNKLTCSYIDTSGLTMNMTLTVIRMGIAGDVKHCTNYSTSSSGTFVCQLTTNTSYRYSMTGTYYSNPTNYLWQSGWLNLSPQAVTFGAIGLFLSFVIIGILSFSAHWDVRIAIILTTFGMIFCVFIGLISFGVESVGLMLTIAMLGGIVAYKIQT